MIGRFIGELCRVPEGWKKWLLMNGDIFVGRYGKGIWLS